MKIIYNKLIPFKGFKATMLFGLVFARNQMTRENENHEKIHCIQYIEVTVLSLLILALLVGFSIHLLWAFITYYIWYTVEWIIRLFRYKPHTAYRMISMEVEAYNNQDDLDYLIDRKIFNWLKYL